MVNKTGFSLIELTVVVGLASLLSLAIASVLLTSVVSTNRLRNSTKIKQAGNYTLDQIQGLLRNAKSVEVCDSSSGSITITNPDGATTTLGTESDGTLTRIASNSGIYLTPPRLQVSNFSLYCEPSDSYPNLVRLAFDLTNPSVVSTRESRTLHFETAVNLRNE